MIFSLVKRVSVLVQNFQKRLFFLGDEVDNGYIGLSEVEIKNGTHTLPLLQQLPYEPWKLKNCLKMSAIY